MYPGSVVAVFINNPILAVDRKALVTEIIIWNFVQTVERKAMDETKITIIVRIAFG